MLILNKCDVNADKPFHMKDAALTCNAADASASGWGWAFTFMHATKIADGTDPNGY